jgi:hypothetical protein
MASNFPSSLDSFTNPSSSDAMDSVSVPHASQHSDLNDAVEALQAKVGADSSGVASSHDYKIAQLPAGVLASAKSTADFTGIGTSGTDIVNVSVTLSASRQLKVTGFANLDQASTNLYGRLRIMDGPVATGNLLQDANVALGTGSGYADALHVVVIHFATFAAGTHDLYLASLTNTGTIRANGNIGGVSYHGIIVEDVGAA